MENALAGYNASILAYGQVRPRLQQQSSQDIAMLPRTRCLLQSSQTSTCSDCCRAEPGKLTQCWVETLILLGSFQGFFSTCLTALHKSVEAR